MNEITIDIDYYLSDDEKRRIAMEAFREACQKKAAADFERILSNASYDLVHKEVDAAFNGDMISAVREKALKVISELGTYSVFRPGNPWDETQSKGWIYMQAALEAYKPQIHARVAEIIQGIDEVDVRDLLAQHLLDAIVARLKGEAT